MYKKVLAFFLMSVFSVLICGNVFATSSIGDSTNAKDYSHYSQNQLISLYADDLSPSERTAFLSKLASSENVSASFENGFIEICYETTKEIPTTRAGGVREYSREKSREVWDMYTHSKTIFVFTAIFLETNNGQHVEVKDYSTRSIYFPDFGQITAADSQVTANAWSATSGAISISWRFTATYGGRSTPIILTCESDAV